MRISKQDINLYLIMLVVSIGGLLFGYDIGVIAGTLTYLKNDFNFTNEQLELIVGGVFMGSLIGSLIAGQFADFLGRKLAIFIISVLFLIGTYTAVTAHSFTELFIARLFLGGGAGFIGVVIPLYIVEVAPPSCRGKCLAWFQTLLTIGILLAYLVDFFFSFSSNWRAMFSCLFIPASMLFILTYILPETPRWLILHNRSTEAKKVLEKTRSLSETLQEYELILENTKMNSSGSWKAFLKRKNIYFLLVTIAIAICNQMIGCTAILQYAPLILKNAGIESDTVTVLGTVGIGILNFVFCILNLFLVDLLGRRPLYLLGTLGVFASEFLLGVSNALPFSPEVQGILSLISLLMFISFFAVGPSTLVWLAISELLPNAIRAKGMSISLFFNGAAAAVSSSVFLTFNEWIGVSGIFFIFSFFAALYWLVIKLFLPESKNIRLENITSGNQELLTSKR